MIDRLNAHVKAIIPIVGNDYGLGELIHCFAVTFKVCPNCNGNGTSCSIHGYRECRRCGGDGHGYGDHVIMEEYCEIFTCGYRKHEILIHLMDYWDYGTSRNRVARAVDQDKVCLQAWIEWFDLCDKQNGGEDV